MAHPSIAIHGCYNSANFGDILLLDLMAIHLERKYGVRAVCPWLAPSQRDHVRALPGGFRECVGLDAAVFGGGGYFADGDKRTTRRLLRYSVPARLWRWTGVPYVVVGVGVGPLLSKRGMERLRVVCDGARLICPRDEESRDMLLERGVDAARVEATADLVLGLDRDEIPEHATRAAAALLGIDPAQRDERSAAPFRRIGLHLPLVPRHTPLLEPVIDATVAALAGRDDIEAIWFCDHGSEHLETVRARCADRIPRLRLIERQDHWTTVALIAALDAVVTSKLHVGITAWALGVAPCGFSTHPKSARLYRQIGRADFQTMASPDASAITDWLRIFLSDPKRFAEECAVARREVPRLARRNFAVVDEMIDSAVRGARR